MKLLGMVLLFVFVCLIIYLVITWADCRARKKFMKYFCDERTCRLHLREVARRLNALYSEEIELQQLCFEKKMDRDKYKGLLVNGRDIKKTKKIFWESVSLAYIYFNVAKPIKYSDCLDWIIQ